MCILCVKSVSVPSIVDYILFLMYSDEPHSDRPARHQASGRVDDLGSTLASLRNIHGGNVQETTDGWETELTAKPVIPGLQWFFSTYHTERWSGETEVANRGRTNAQGIV